MERCKFKSCCGLVPLQYGVIAIGCVQIFGVVSVLFSGNVPIKLIFSMVIPLVSLGLLVYGAIKVEI